MRVNISDEALSAMRDNAYRRMEHDSRRFDWAYDTRRSLLAERIYVEMLYYKFKQEEKNGSNSQAV